MSIVSPLNRRDLIILSFYFIFHIQLPRGTYSGVAADPLLLLLLFVIRVYSIIYNCNKQIDSMEKYNNSFIYAFFLVFGPAFLTPLHAISSIY